MDLVVEVYKLTGQFPVAERYGLSAQMRRAAISIPSNIAEGRRRLGRKNYLHFLIMAYSSGAELETQLEIAKRLALGRDISFSEADNLLLQLMKMLNKTTMSLGRNDNPNNQDT